MAQSAQKTRKRVYTKEEIQRANQVDMVDFIQSHGQGTLEGHGRYFKYHVNGHDSLVIDKKLNYFYHNGQQRGDNLVALLREYEGYSFPDAVGFLLGEDLEPHKEFVEEPIGPYQQVYEQDTTYDQAQNYLRKVRGIDKDIVDFLFTNGYVIQDKKYKSAVFQWREFGLPQGEIVGATSQGTTVDYNQYGKRGTAKYIAKNSKRHYGFSITLGKPKQYLFFESTIDLLSYWSLHKELDNSRLMSLEGLKHQSILNFIQETNGYFDQLPTEGIVYGVDNDAAGHRLFDFVEERINIIGSRESDKPAENINQIPFDHEIPNQMIQLYQEAAEDFPNVNWVTLATVHKIETNYSNTNKIANNFNLHRYFAQDATSKLPNEEIDVALAVQSAAEELHAVLLDAPDPNDPVEQLVSLYVDQDESESKRQLIKEKIQYYYDDYYAGNYQRVEEISKDWNELLLQQRSEGMVTEREPLAFDPKRDGLDDYLTETFDYYLQDSPTQEAVRGMLVGKYGINVNVVNALIKKGLIRQDVNDRIVFLWNNEGEVIGGQIRGTFYNKAAFKKTAGYEKKVMDKSEEGYGFNVTLGRPDKMHLFQTPEDLLAFWTMHIDDLKDTVLFSLSNNNPDDVIKDINLKMKAGYKIKQVEFCMGNNQESLDLMDKVAQLESFDRQTGQLTTIQGDKIQFRSLRPRIGIDWLSELDEKRARMAALDRANGRAGQQLNQVVSYSRT